MKGQIFNKFLKDQNLKEQWLIKIKRRNIKLIQFVGMCHAYCFGFNPIRKKYTISVGTK